MAAINRTEGRRLYPTVLRVLLQVGRRSLKVLAAHEAGEDNPAYRWHRPPALLTMGFTMEDRTWQN